MSVLISGQNPLLITNIRISSFQRNGKHPMYYRLLKRKGIYGWFVRSFIIGETPFDGVYGPDVIINGVNGNVLKRIECKSYAEANEIRRKLTAELENCIGNFLVMAKLHEDIRHSSY